MQLQEFHNVIFTSGNGSYLTALKSKTQVYLAKKNLTQLQFLACSGFIFIIDNKNRLICLSQKW